MRLLFEEEGEFFSKEELVETRFNFYRKKEKFDSFSKNFHEFSSLKNDNN